MTIDAESTSFTSNYETSMTTDSPLIDLEPLNVPDCHEQEECEVEENLSVVPFEEMEFECQDEAYQFYNAYGLVYGFNIRKCTNYKTIEGKITSVRLVCSKNGLKSRQRPIMDESIEVNTPPFERTPKKRLSDKRCGCKSALQLRLHENGKWRVSAFHKDHNHELVSNTPSKKRNLKSHKYFTPEERENIRILMEQNVRTTQIKEYLAEKRGGKQHLTCTKKDVGNQITSLNRQLVGVDVDSMLDYFLRKQESDPGFFFAIEPDEDNAPKNIFWVDGRSRRAYKEFGDVVTFDTTYNTNKYSMPLAPFLVESQGSTSFWMMIIADWIRKYFV